MLYKFPRSFAYKILRDIMIKFSLMVRICGEAYPRNV